MSFQILGTGSAHPAKVVTNDEIATLVETSDEWIRTRTGIESRHFCVTETLTDLCVEAAKKALEMAKVKPEELDLIVVDTLRADTLTPSEACLVQYEIGASCPCFDLNAACSGFLYSLDVVDGYFTRGRIKKALVIAAETMSRLINFKQRSTCPLFGDGAGAVVLGEGEALKSMRLSAEGHPDTLRLDNFEGDSPYIEKKGYDHYLHMDGMDTYRFAVTNCVSQLKKVAKDAGMPVEDVDWVLPHQANLRIIEAAAAKLPIPREKFCVNIERWGNTSAATIPILMDECNRAHRFRLGDKLGLVAFGGGLTTGAAIIEWTIDPETFPMEVPDA